MVDVHAVRILDPGVPLSLDRTIQSVSEANLVAEVVAVTDLADPLVPIVVEPRRLLLVAGETLVGAPKGRVVAPQPLLGCPLVPVLRCPQEVELSIEGWSGPWAADSPGVRYILAALSRSQAENRGPDLLRTGWLLAWCGEYDSATVRLSRWLEEHPRGADNSVLAARALLASALSGGRSSQAIRAAQRWLQEERSERSITWGLVTAGLTRDPALGTLATAGTNYAQRELDPWLRVTTAGTTRSVRSIAQNFLDGQIDLLPGTPEDQLLPRVAQTVVAAWQAEFPASRLWSLIAATQRDALLQYLLMANHSCPQVFIGDLIMEAIASGEEAARLLPRLCDCAIHTDLESTVRWTQRLAELGIPNPTQPIRARAATPSVPPAERVLSAAVLADIHDSEEATSLLLAAAAALDLDVVQPLLLALNELAPNALGPFVLGAAKGGVARAHAVADVLERLGAQEQADELRDLT